MPIEALTINGTDAQKLRQRREKARSDPSSADRAPRLVAEWLGGDRCRVHFGDVVMGVEPPRTLNPCQLLLASLAACDVDVIATRATLLGLKIERRRAISTSARISASRARRAPAIDGIAYTVRVRRQGATEVQIAALRSALERGSPVGGSLARAIPLSLILEAETG